MTSRKAAVYGVGAALLVTYLASANMPTQERAPRERATRPVATAGTESVAGEVRAQAARLHARMADAPVPAPSQRNPFSFGAASRAGRPVAMHDGIAHAAVASDGAPVLLPPPQPALTLMGIAEETKAGVTRRTAVIGGDGDTLYMVTEGQAVGSRYKVTRIGVDAVELEDLLTHGYRRIAMR